MSYATIGRIPRIVQLLRVKKEEEEEEGGGGISRLAKSQREENTSTLFRPFVTSSFTIRYEASVVSLTRRHRSVSNEFSHSLVYFPPFFLRFSRKKSIPSTRSTRYGEPATCAKLTRLGRDGSTEI